MKTKNQKSKFLGFALALFALLTFSSLTTKAQCGGYQLHNVLNCQVTFDVKVIDCAGNVCSSYIAPVNPGAPVAINCSACGSVCLIKLSVIAVNGTPITPATLTSTMIGATTSIPNCTSGTATFGYYTNNGGGPNTFKVHP